ncbi:MAG: transcriptional regulator, partial [Spirochaetia bacterium]|nr:transcriptional regulator [Spirochaetia bacterium]
PLRIAVASGFHKVESIVGALRANLVDTLITDMKTAKHVIDYLK